jgi:hypothetical protein
MPDDLDDLDVILAAVMHSDADTHRVKDAKDQLIIASFAAARDDAVANGQPERAELWNWIAARMAMIRDRRHSDVARLTIAVSEGTVTAWEDDPDARPATTEERAELKALTDELRQQHEETVLFVRLEDDFGDGDDPK